ncbi:Acetolactate synthase large subunit biosynthetic [Penicillium fimorum]|uniref:Acetolactate synthase large subunit biosynthetic n=1 Tax=Penicillium fimorum TaxID=1882269 RepID=A0A9W9XJN3_9EURO|nr:Acetolactate synthase large subunit biosynthetic [Penicillium fimorum]
MSLEPKGSNRNIAPMGIAGTTQDRATYDILSTETLTYGPAFIDLAASYVGNVIIGLNRRRLDDIPNVISAAPLVQSKMDNLNSIELQNKPNYRSSVMAPS